MTEWARVSVGELANWYGGLTPPKTEPRYWGGSVPWISSKEVTGGVLRSTKHGVTDAALAETSLRVVPANSVAVVVRSGILRRTFPVALVPFAAAVNQDVKIGVPKPGVLPEFLRYMLEANAQRILDNCRKAGTTVQSIDVPGLMRLSVSLPPLAEQRRIVDLVGAVDRCVLALNDEAAALRSVYRQASAGLWDDRDILRPLSDVMKLAVERQPVASDVAYPMAGVLNAGQGLIDRGSLRGSETDYSSLNRLSSGQVVMRKLTAWEGPISVVPPRFDGYYASAEFPTFTLSDGVDPEYMAHICRTPRLWLEMKQRVTGTVQRRKRLNPDQLMSIKVPIPPFDRQCALAAGLDALVASVSGLESEAGRLGTVRAALLDGLLNGTLVIPVNLEVSA